MENKYASTYTSIPKPSDYTVSYWLANVNRHYNISPEKLIDQHVQCKILIIGTYNLFKLMLGAGITGLSCAYWLSELGEEGIITLDARDICTGIVTRNS